MKSLLRSAVVLSLLASATALAEEPSSSSSAPPQSFFQVRTGIYPALALGTPNAYGIGALVEPMFTLTQNVSVGLRIDGAALFAVAIGGQDVSAGIRAQAAFLARGDFFFTQGDIRPFVGAGFGLYTFGGTSGGTTGASIDAGQSLGVAPELGINFGGFRLAGLYHYVFAAPPPGSVARNFFALELSWRLF